VIANFWSILSAMFTRGIGKMRKIAISPLMHCCLQFIAMTLLQGAQIHEDPTYCAAKITVKSNSGKPMIGIAVGVIDKGKQLVEVLSDASGEAKLCDLPLHAVDIVVGNGRCGSLLLHQVRAAWPKTLQLVATYNTNVNCMSALAAPPAECLLVLRMRDEVGKSIAGALLKRRDGPGGTASDALGRMYFLIKTNESISGEIHARAIRPLPFWRPASLTRSL